MNNPTGAPSAPPPRPADTSREKTGALRKFLIASVVLVLAFAYPLYDLVRHAVASSLLSYIPLVPVATGYLVWLRRPSLPAANGPDRPLATLFAVSGLAVLAVHWIVRPAGASPGSADGLTLITLSFLLCFYCLCSFFGGRDIFRALLFPLCFLVFMIPLPDAAVARIETWLQHGSAEVAYVLFSMSDTPLLREGLIFRLPGISLEVAPECSGIHSTLVLVLTGLIAANLFLRSGWKRAVLVLAVIPLALLRNGVRIFVIGELCVRVSPEMIHAPVHRNGGPYFFAASLIPLGILLYLLARSDSPARAAKPRQK